MTEISRERNDLKECVDQLRRTLRYYKDLHDLPPDLHEYWRKSEQTLKRLCIEARASVLQEFMNARRSPLMFARWWPYGDISRAMLDGKVLMLRVEKGKEREWKEKFEVVDTREVREMLSRKKFQNREPTGEHVEVFQDQVR